MTMMYEKKGRYIVEFPDIPTARQHQIEIDLDERRGSYKEVELGFDEARAVQEAKRCLSCRRCLGCALCWAECKPEAIVFEMEDEYFDLQADSVIITPGVERTLDRMDRRFGLGEHLNMITELQFERMLSESGPSGGLIIRPYDGEIPASIALVQGYDNASPQMHHGALCFGVNEAILARRKLQDAEIAICGNNLGNFLKEHEETVKQLDRIEILEASVRAVEAAENQSLRLSLEVDGSETNRTFDLVILLTQPQIPKVVKDLSKSLGLSLTYASFLAAGGAGLISTEKERVSLASLT
jgi:heterodisulfide reductase subunit A-like polyferredoxin